MDRAGLQDMGRVGDKYKEKPQTWLKSRRPSASTAVSEPLRGGGAPQGAQLAE
jgi:hypothetical protein